MDAGGGGGGGIVDDDDPRRPELQPAFRRTFSDTPEAFAPFAGLARALRSMSDPRKRRRPAQPDDEEQPGDDDDDKEDASAGALERGAAGGGPRGRLRGEGKPQAAAVGAAALPIAEERGDASWTDDREREICAQDFLIKLGAALQLYGSPVPRTEAVLAALAAHLNVDGQFYLLPDLLICSFGAQAATSEVHMIPCPQDEDIDAYRYRKTTHLIQKMLTCDSAADSPAEAVEAAEAGPRRRACVRPFTLKQAVAKLDAIVSSPALYPKWAIFLSYVSSSAAVAIVFWGGDLWDAAVAAVSAAFVALVNVPGSDNFFVAKVQILLSAILTGVFSTMGSTFIERPCSKAIFYAPITTLLPGWALTFSLIEFSMNAALLGTARMASALVVGLLLGYGIQIGHDAVFTCLSAGTRAALQDWATSTTCEMQPWYFQLAAFPFVSIPYAIILHAAPIQWPAMLLTGGGAIALINGPLSDAQEHLTVFLIAFLIGTVANAHTRATASPALILVVNGIWMLVPDCMALSSAKSYLENNLAQGWNTAVSLLLIAISVAAGLLLSQGLAVGATSLYGWCSAKATKRGRRRWRVWQQRAESRGGVIQGGMDSVYF